MNKKKLLRWAGAAAAFGLAISVKFPVYAGDINAAEQMVIDYYNGTFYYDGKTYVATDAAKSSVYAKLSQDGVDLTEQEARSAIRQASGKIGEGIEQGYLIEVSSEEPEIEDAPENENNGTKPEDGTDTDKTMAGTPGSGNEGSAGNENGAGEAGPGDETITGTSGSGNGANTGEPGSGNSTGLTGNGTGSDGTGMEEIPAPFQKVDVTQLLKEAQKEGESYVQIAPGGDFTITVERYLQGTVAAVSQEGYVLFEGGLPLKNTGYETGEWKIAIIVLITGLCIALAVGGRKGKKKILYIAVPAVFTLIMGIVLAVGIYPSVKASAAEWRAAWIMNAPEYEYGQGGLDFGSAEGKREDWQKNLTAGSQYGEICWEKNNKKEKIPLYYGDREEILQLGAGTYTGFGLPGQGKRILAGAHDTTFFSGLESLEKGDTVTLQTIGGSFTYKVTKTEVVDAAQEFTEDHGEELILYTCYPFGDTEQMRTQRYLVYAAPLQESENGE